MSAPELPRPQDDYTLEYTPSVLLAPQRVVLVIVDMQYASASRSEGQGRMLALSGREQIGRERFDRIEQVVVPTLQKLLEFCRSRSIPVIHVVTGSTDPKARDVVRGLRALALARHNLVGSRAHEVLDELRPRPGEFVLRKTTMSAFTSTGIDATLRALGKDQLLLTGVSTNQCVFLTAADAADRGYECVVVEDCCGAAKLAYHDAALVTFQRLLGRVASSSTVVDELTDRANIVDSRQLGSSLVSEKQ